MSSGTLRSVIEYGLRLLLQSTLNTVQFTSDMFCVPFFYPCDAMLAQVLAMALCLSVCVCHKSVFYQNGSMNRDGFGM